MHLTASSKQEATNLLLDLYRNCFFKYLLEDAHFQTILVGFLRIGTANLGKKSCTVPRGQRQGLENEAKMERRTTTARVGWQAEDR